MSPHPQPASVRLVTIGADDRPDWLARMEAAFAAGVRDAGLQPGDEPIPDPGDMEQIIRDANNDTLNITRDGEVIGGAVVTGAERGRRSLELFFIDAGSHGGGIGARAWHAIEARYPDTEVWETVTPYFDRRNIHFYINRCGFHAVEFYHPGHPDEHDGAGGHPGPELSFRFEKRMADHPATAAPA